MSPQYMVTVEFRSNGINCTVECLLSEATAMKIFLHDLPWAGRFRFDDAEMCIVFSPFRNSGVLPVWDNFLQPVTLSWQMAFVRCRRRGILTYVCSTVVGCWVFFSTGRFLHNAQQNFFAHIAASLEHPSCSAISNAQCQLVLAITTKTTL
ncbi:hypothetical protein T4B_6195 [Trichinella pseudospiralis]|uniref:Uncharacterized protein n=2 Tax=Trichinella pseudospiralis TaxID=6337 RepID=A0A0V0XYU9_TRIPS|nr:hypothetical protein T4E_3219 [Trichinella pseudospiralis]KRY91273.1 hypothetical protein T4D_8696 [Trichinella pseudospiralis]KRZ20655.1 hypothetical protein T4B_6195 [Trichinella pseudospiralis]